ncbi:unnamed protein product [Caenorhabditis angaria]|uniref:Alpha-1,3-glucosyltransferase n=1 Tax=Caenorhabditis angaria TaxID=860376 RepID=A0A9P1IB42_9PELO|nr:unnamed protein product [Caenorhabditis angaria]
MLTAIFLLSLYFLEKDEFCKAGLVFSILINFKHIYIYYALGYVFYYLLNYFHTLNHQIPIKILFLGSAILAPFSASFLPFLATGGPQSILDILHRLFPISRGLTHAFWAPNFWTLYNLLDLVLYKLTRILKVAPNLVAPSYTNGLVQEYEHSVLPNVSPIGTLILVVVSSLVAMFALIWRGKERDFSIFATISALCFFYFGYHVHEKAIILITIPYTIYAIKNPKFIKNLIFIQQIATFSIFPLLFTKFEILVKYAIGATYFLLQLFLAKKMTRVPISIFLPTGHCVFYTLLMLAEIYNTFIHAWIFGAKTFEFFPLLLISLVNSIGVTWFFATCLWRILGADETWNLAKCRMREELIKKRLTYSVQSVDYEEHVEIVGGIDISASKTNPDFVVISFSIFTYPNLLHLATFSDCQILETPYIPQFLAIREAEKLAAFVRKCCEQWPNFRPDVIFCDGFGEFHSRNCGMACHVGALTGIATIGVAKNLGLGQENKENLEEFLKAARKSLDSEKKKGFVAFDLDEKTPCRMNILKLNGNITSGVFVSAGYGIELDVATQIAIQCLKTSTTCEPIRKADLTSRDLVRKYFD